MAVSFIGGANRRKPPTCHKSLTNFITQCCIDIRLALMQAYCGLRQQILYWQLFLNI